MSHEETIYLKDFCYLILIVKISLITAWKKFQQRHFKQIGVFSMKLIQNSTWLNIKCKF